MPNYGYLGLIILVMLFQPVFDWSGTVGATIGGLFGLIGVIYGVKVSQRVKELEISQASSNERLERAKEEQEKDIANTKAVFEAYKYLVTQLQTQVDAEVQRNMAQRTSDKDELKQARWHLRVCEKQQGYLQAKLLQEGVLTAEDLVNLQKLEVEVLP